MLTCMLWLCHDRRRAAAAGGRAGLGAWLAVQQERGGLRHLRRGPPQVRAFTPTRLPVWTWCRACSVGSEGGRRKTTCRASSCWHGCKAGQETGSPAGLIRLVPRRGAGPDLRKEGRQIDEYLMRLLNGGTGAGAGPNPPGAPSKVPLYCSFYSALLPGCSQFSCSPGPLLLVRWPLDAVDISLQSLAPDTCSHAPLASITSFIGLRTAMMSAWCHLPKLCMLAHLAAFVAQE